MKKINFVSILSTALLLLTSFVYAQVQPKFEEWRTPLTCGGKRYEVVSRCQASSDPMELNTCEPGQRLMLEGRSILVPTSPVVKGKPVLFATFWSCLETAKGPFIRLGYSRGEGRSADDEDEEFFDAELQVVSNKSKIRNLYNALPQAKTGYVSSIMPSGGN